MKSVIICEGNTDLTLIQYFLEKAHNWEYIERSNYKKYEEDGNIHTQPIYWMLDSGKENGLKPLIYIRKYNQDTVGRVRPDYLHKTQKAIESTISRADMVIESSANLS